MFHFLSHCRISVWTKLFDPLRSNNGIIILYLDYSLIFAIQTDCQLYFFHFSYFPSDDQSAFVRHLGFKRSFAVTGHEQSTFLYFIDKRTLMGLKMVTGILLPVHRLY